MGTAGITSGGRVNRDGIGAVVRFTPEGGATVMRPILGGASYASEDSLTASFGLGQADEGTVDVLWPGGVRNRFYDVHASEHVVLPEIPCSYDARWGRRHDYQHCVAQALGELADAGKLPPHMRGRLMESAMRAFHDAHDRDDDSNNDS